MGQSLIATAKQFGTEEQCLAYLEMMRWPEGVKCLTCGSDKVAKIVTNETTRERTNRKGEVIEVPVPARRLYQCNNEGCRFQFSATSGTIFDKSHLSLTKWFLAVAIIANAKKSVSAKQMQRDLGCSYPTAWFLDHRIREAMQGEEGLFGGTVEVDATYHGGAYDKRRKRAAYDKQAIAGIIQRKGEAGHSRVKAFPVEREIAKVMTGAIRDNVAIDAQVMTDEHGAYVALSKSGWRHQIVSHSKDEWVRGNVHTQGIESFWSLFKRGVIGSFHQVSVKHLHRYLNEFSFRFNNREAEDLFAMIIMNLVIGTALRYKVLTVKPSEPSALPDASA
ncbi:MAG TPA: IS1595 family transposase [Bryobacteraceae bacterium]|nr:IS1595 family transposase [Bryobacteraceae bacterium]